MTMEYNIMKILILITALLSFSANAAVQLSWTAGAPVVGSDVSYNNAYCGTPGATFTFQASTVGVVNTMTFDLLDGTYGCYVTAFSDESGTESIPSMIAYGVVIGGEVFPIRPDEPNGLIMQTAP